MSSIVQVTKWLRKLLPINPAPPVTKTVICKTF
jgi:hypothetical protein